MLCGFLFRKKHPFWLLALLMLNAGLFCLHFAFWGRYPEAFRTWYPYNSLLISIGLYVFFKNLHTSKISKGDRRLLLLTLIEPVIITSHTILRWIDPEFSFSIWSPLDRITFALDPDSGPDFISDPSMVGQRIQMCFFFLFAFSFLVVLIKLYRVLNKAEAQHLSFFCSDSFRYYRWIRRFVLFCTVIGVYAILIVNSGFFIEINHWIALSLYFTMAIFGLGLFGLGIYTPLRYAKEKDFKAFLEFLEKSNTPEAAKSSSSLLPSAARPIKGDQVEKNKQKLIDLLEQEKIYRNPDLSLATLAGHLNTSPRSLSRTISEGTSMNFFELINSYRVKEVQRNLLSEDYKHYAILSLGLEAGFKSKSTFYDAFKKNTGMTPSQYKKSNSQ